MKIQRCNLGSFTWMPIAVARWSRST